MATITRWVNAEGSLTDWQKIGGLSVVATMNSDDNGTSFFNNDGESGLNDSQSFTFDPLPSYIAQVIGHTAYFKAAKRSGNDKTVQPAAWFGTWDPGANEVLTVAGTWVSFSRTDMNTATPTVDQMNAGELRLRHTGGTVGDAGWTYTYWDVNTVLTGGGLITAFLQWLPPLFAVASHGLLKCEVTQILSKLNPRPSNDEEVRKILEAFRVRPCYNF